MRVCVLSVLLATWMRSVFGITIEIYPPSPRVNQTVILNVGDVRGTLLYADWYQGKNTSADFQIIRIDRGGSKIPGRRYFAEADVFENGSLQIRNAQKVHEGYYTVNVQTESPLQDATVLLTLDSTGGLGGGAVADSTEGLGGSVVADSTEGLGGSVVADSTEGLGGSVVADSSGGLGGGAIAGIIIGVLAVVSAVIGIIVYVFMKKNNSSDLAK